MFALCMVSWGLVVCCVGGFGLVAWLIWFGCLVRDLCVLSGVVVGWVLLFWVGALLVVGFDGDFRAELFWCCGWIHDFGGFGCFGFGCYGCLSLGFVVLLVVLYGYFAWLVVGLFCWIG